MSLFDLLRRRPAPATASATPQPERAAAGAAAAARPAPPSARPVAAPRGFAALPGSDSAALARIGAAVVTRLEADPAVRRVPATGLDMFVAQGFLSDAECAAMVALIDADVRPSTSLHTASEQLVRTSETCRLSSDQPLVRTVEARICALLGIADDQSETIQGQRYTAGQQFRMHNDYFAGGQPYSAVVASEGGQRSWTAMVYLDRPEGGGATVFPHAGVSVSPRPGALLTWNNMTAAGEPNGYAHHAGAPVTAGVKHVLTKWFRERRWEGSERSDALRQAR